MLVEIPYPNEQDRREILKLWDQQLGLQLTPEAIEEMVQRTDGTLGGLSGDAGFSGDHLNAICRAIARERVRNRLESPSTEELVSRVLDDWLVGIRAESGKLA